MIKQKRILALALAIIMSFTTLFSSASALTADAGEIVLGFDNVRIDENTTTATAVMQKAYDKNTWKTLDGIDLFYNFDNNDVILAGITGNKANLDINDELQFFAVGTSADELPDLTFEFQNVQKTTEVVLSAQRPGEAPGGVSMTKVDGKRQYLNNPIVHPFYIIKQQPLTVNVTNITGSAVKTKTQEYNTGEQTYSNAGQEMDLNGTNIIKVDTEFGAQSRPAFDITVPEGFKAVVKVDGNVVSEYSSNNTFTMPNAVTSAQTVDITFEQTATNYYHVIYDGNGATAGVPVDSVNYQTGDVVSPLKSGASMTAPAEKQAFVCWAESAHTLLAKNDSLPADKVTSVTITNSDETVYAVWGVDENENGVWDGNETERTLTFDLDGGTDDSGLLTSMNVVVGQGVSQDVLDASAAVEKHGYILNGWKNVAAGVSYANLSSFVMPDEDITLTAIWTNRDADPIRPYDKEDPENKNPDEADKDGWLVPSTDEYDDNGENDDIIIIPNTDDNGDDNSTLDTDNGDLYLPEGGIAADKDGNATGDVYIPGDVISPNGTVRHTVIITYVDQNSIEIATEVRVLFEGTSYDATTDVKTISGYTFQQAVPGVMVAIDYSETEIPSIEMQYIDDSSIVVEYTVTYDANTGSNPPAVETYEENTVVTLADGSTMTPPTDPSDATPIVFGGWSKTAHAVIELPENGGTKPADMVESFTITQDETVYAVWGKDENGNNIPDVFEYTLAFSYASGVVADDVFAAAYSLAQDENVPAEVLAASNPTRSGYNFAGWKDPTNNAVYTNLNTFKMPDRSVTLVATWSSKGGNGNGNSTPKYTLTYNTNGGSNIASETVKSGTVITLKNDTTREGYSFDGWYSDKELTTKVTEVKMTKNTTVYAKWNAKLITDDHFAYMIGNANGTFKPDASMTRAEAAMMFYRLLDNKTMEGSVNLSDVSSSAWYATAVNTLASKNIVTGYADGTFKPDRTISRAEFATMAARFSNLASGDKSFTDVSSSHWAYNYIISAATKGWINGYTDGSFKPEQNITRAEVVKMANAILNRHADKKFVDENTNKIKSFSDLVNSHWAYYEIMEASNAHDFDRAENATAETWTLIR